LDLPCIAQCVGPRLPGRPPQDRETCEQGNPVGRIAIEFLFFKISQIHGDVKGAGALRKTFVSFVSFNGHPW
jgi:hypothetical protein